MALLSCNFFSDVLGLSCSMNVILPQETNNQIGLEGTATQSTLGFPTLYLLHGLSDDHTIWVRRTSIERYAAQYGIAVVMPAADRSFYTDTAYGARYWTFVSEELPEIVGSFFRVSQRREDTYVAGLSMGGYGAFKLALAHPGRFAAAASLSGALDMAHSVTASDRHDEAFWEPIFGDPSRLAGSENDLMRLAQDAAATGDAPRLFQYCGTNDFLYQENQTFLAHAKKLALPLEFHEDDGDHSWDVWDRWIQAVLSWMFPSTA